MRLCGPMSNCSPIRTCRCSARSVCARRLRHTHRRQQRQLLGWARPSEQSRPCRSEYPFQNITRSIMLWMFAIRTPTTERHTNAGLKNADRIRQNPHRSSRRPHALAAVGRSTLHADPGPWVQSKQCFGNSTESKIRKHITRIAAFFCRKLGAGGFCRRHEDGQSQPIDCRTLDLTDSASCINCRCAN